MAEGGDDNAQDIYQPSKRTNSEVWTYFGYYKNAEGQLIEDSYPVCRTCRKIVFAKGSNLISVTITHKFIANAR